MSNGIFTSLFAMGDSLFTGLFASSGTPIITEPTPIIYSTLLSADAITSPEIGSPGTLTGSPTFDADGMNINANSEYAEFTVVPSTVITTEIIVKPNFASTSGVEAYFIGRGGSGSRPTLRWSLGKEIEYCTGNGSVCIATSGITFSAGDQLIIRTISDEGGDGIDGSADKMRIYINSVLVASGTVTPPAHTATLARIGNYTQNNMHANSKLKDYKVWDEEVIP